MNKISGYICIRDGIALDFCFMEAIKSLIPVCDELIVADFGSMDGTLGEVMKLNDSRIRILTSPRIDIVRNIHWWTETLNWARLKCNYDYQLTLDADEVLSEKAYPYIYRAAAEGRALWFHRNNYWNDPQHLAPSGSVCGDAVVRFGPSDLPMVSDEPHPGGEPEIRKLAGDRRDIPPELLIHHYGFIRKPDALIRKCEINLKAFFGAPQDERLLRAQAEGRPWQELCPFDKPLQEYHGTHPEVAHQWLIERGYKI